MSRKTKDAIVDLFYSIEQVIILIISVAFLTSDFKICYFNKFKHHKRNSKLPKYITYPKFMFYVFTINIILKPTLDVMCDPRNIFFGNPSVETAQTVYSLKDLENDIDDVKLRQNVLTKIQTDEKVKEVLRM